MVKVQYVDGSEEIFEAYWDDEIECAFQYDDSMGIISIFLSEDEYDNVYVPIEMIKSIRYIKTED